MEYITYYGQDTTGYDFIGTEQHKIPLTPETDVEEAVKELKRCLGKNTFLFLFREKREEAEDAQAG